MLIDFLFIPSLNNQHIVSTFKITIKLILYVFAKAPRDLCWCLCSWLFWDTPWHMRPWMVERCLLKGTLANAEMCGEHRQNRVTIPSEMFQLSHWKNPQHAWPILYVQTCVPAVNKSITVVHFGSLQVKVVK